LPFVALRCPSLCVFFVSRIQGTIRGKRLYFLTAKIGKEGTQGYDKLFWVPKIGKEAFFFSQQK